MEINSKELLLMIDAVAKEKGVEKEKVAKALCEGIETALRRNFPEGSHIEVTLNEETGELDGWRLFKIVDQIENVEAEMLQSEIEDEQVEDGYVLEHFDFNLNRQQFNITKQVALQKIKHDSRAVQIDSLLARPIALLHGNVKVARKDRLIVDCSGLDIEIPRRNLLLKDNYKVNDKVYFVLEKDRNQYVGSRVNDAYLIEAFKREIVQIEEGDIEIVSCVRNPGFRSKVVVKAVSKNIGDPVRFCIGAKGAHIKNINSFLNGEAIDIVGYDPDIAQLLVKAMNPVEVQKMLIDEENHSIDLCVPDESIALAIGKSGKNIEMVSKLIGWDLKVYTHSQWDEKESEDSLQSIRVFMDGLNCDEDLAVLLVENGYATLEEIAYVPKEEFDVEGLDDETIEVLRENARQTLGNPILNKRSKGINDLVVLGFTSDEIRSLQDNSVLNMEDVADLSTYDLQDVLTEIDMERAQKIIVQARSAVPVAQAA